jgi:hypothetical protein
VAEQNPAAWLQSRNDHPAILYRQMLASMTIGQAAGDTVGQGGVAPGYGGRLVVTGSVSIMQVTVDTGAVFIAGSNAWQGMYFCINTGAVNLSIAAAHATQFRRDLVIAQVLDTAYGDGSSQWQLAVVQGANSVSSPAPLPTQPNSSELLGIVSVDPGITNLSGKVTSFRRTVGIANAYRYSSAQTGQWGPRSAYTPGALLYDQATSEQTLYVGDNNGVPKFVARAGSWTSYTPAVSGWGSATFAIRTGKYQMLGEKACAVIIRLITSSAGTGTAVAQVALPFAPNRSGYPQFIPLHYESSAGADNDPRLGGDAFIMESGSGTMIDRLYVTAGNSLGSLNPPSTSQSYLYGGINGNNVPSGSRWTIQGVYELA